MATRDRAMLKPPRLHGSMQQGWRPGGDLRQPEIDMRDKAAAGELMDFGDSPPSSAAAEAWGPERTIRAEVLQHLLVDGKLPVHARGVRIRGARISGFLNLESATLRCPLRLESCYFDGPYPVFDYATVSLLTLTSCRLAGFTGDTLTVTKGLYFSDSTFTGPLWLADANVIGILACSGTQLTTAHVGNALVATRMKVDGCVLLNQGFNAAGAISFGGASITGNFECSGAQLNGRGEDGNVLVADGLKVGGDVLLDRGFTAAGGLSVIGADVTGDFQCGGAQLNRANNDGNALVADRLKVGHDLFLDSDASVNQVFTSAGTLWLAGASITGNFQCSGAQLNGRGEDGNVLVADGLKVGGDVFFDQRFTAAGGLSIIGASITGNFECGGAQLNGANDDGNALVGDGLKVGGDVFFNGGFTAAGTLWLPGASITGNFECSGAQLNGANNDGNALVADGLKVGHDLFLDSDASVNQVFTAAGGLSIIGADVTGDFQCSGAQLNGASNDGNALVADRLKVGGSAFLKDGFMAGGGVSLQSVYVGGSLELSLGEPAENQAKKPTNVRTKTALDLTGAQIVHKLWWNPKEQVTRLVTLEDMTVGQLEDFWGTDTSPRPNGYWPRADQGRLRLDGFAYTRFAGEQQATLEQRLTWIGSQPQPTWAARLVRAIRAPRPAWLESKSRRSDRRARAAYGFAPRPYGQLANVYQQAGQDKEARTVVLARRRDLRLYGNLSRYRRILNWLLDKTIQYGYQTWRAVAGIAALYIVILLLFWYAQYRAGLIVPVQSVNELHSLPTASNCTSSYPCFSPVGYAIDTVIPIINVHQADYWGPNARAPLGWFFVYASWVGVILGWTLATLAVAGYTGLVRNTDSL
jgi:hypothetical protein